MSRTDNAIAWRSPRSGVRLLTDADLGYLDQAFGDRRALPPSEREAVEAATYALVTLMVLDRRGRAAAIRTALPRHLSDLRAIDRAALPAELALIVSRLRIQVAAATTISAATPATPWPYSSIGTVTSLSAALALAIKSVPSQRPQQARRQTFRVRESHPHRTTPCAPNAPPRRPLLAV